MSESIAESPQITDLSKNDILDFLKNNPTFLQENPDVLEALIPPKKRPMRGKPADFQAYVIERLRADKQEISQTAEELIQNARANMNNQSRIHEGVLRLLEAQRFDDFIHAMTMDLPSILGVDMAVFVVEADGEQIPHIQTTGIRVLPSGTIDKWMEGKDVLLQDNISGIEAIYGGGATLVRSQILLRIGISMDTPPAILAFASREPDMFNEHQATDQILFLARVIERCFRTWLNIRA